MKGSVIAGKVLLKLATKELKTTSGIYTVASRSDNQQEGEVVAVGISVDDEKVEAKVGDTVICSKSSGVKVEIDGETFSLINHRDILFIR